VAIFSTDKILFLLVLALWSTTPSAQVPAYDFPSFDNLVAKRGLPDPFMMVDGRRVKTLGDWEKQRMYIKDMLLYYQYGYYPPAPKNLKVELISSKTILNGKAVEKRLVLSMGPDNLITIRVDLSVPVRGGGPFPVVITGDREWGRTEGLEVATDRGYIVADFFRTDLDPDNDDRTNGVHPHYPEYDWATLSVWAWGYSRVVDYLETLDDVDKDKIVVTGHSRGGKTALLAGAMDRRIAITVPAGSGAGGCGSLKYMQGGAESLMRISRDDKFHYWFQPRFNDFERRVDRLPFDQHFLKALVAPRPMLCTDGLHDEWANPWGAQQTTEAAREVYKFLGVSEKIGNHYRQGGHHHNVEDWQALLDFSDYNFFGKALPGDFYKENFEKVNSLINGKSPPPLAWGCTDSAYKEFNPLATANLAGACVVPCPTDVTRKGNHSARNGRNCYSN
jgi:dienelactone hydrolase